MIQPSINEGLRRTLAGEFDAHAWYGSLHPSHKVLMHIHFSPRGEEVSPGEYDPTQPITDQYHVEYAGTLSLSQVSDHLSSQARAAETAESAVAGVI